MRPRTFILIIIVVLLFALAGVLIFLNRSGSSITDVLPGGNGSSETAPSGEESVESPGGDTEPGIPVPSPTPEPPQFQPVVISKVRLPVGELITEDLLEVEQRPITNIALQGGYTFTGTELVAGQIARVEIARGQEILGPMLAVNGDPTDVGSFGSDLALHIPNGEVAIAFPITAESGVALSMRPGDAVDVMMTLRTIEIDPEFRSALPNKLSLVLEDALLSGFSFLFGPLTEGRLEFITELNQVATIIPGTSFGSDRPYEEGPIPKRVTQLSIQNAEVLWVGEWQDPRKIEQDGEATLAEAAAEAQANGQPIPTPTPLPERFEPEPDILILSLSSQEALMLKWAREQGVDIDLTLRSPFDVVQDTNFVTTSVSLPQIIDQGGLAIPEPMNFDLYDGK
ncbi:MAG: hypothetical protein DWQ04_28195 [Chloroflexi bacterium]|nr:MAG: hypothetical protein DWQ04_28195 [Chloroflexota bacterium]